jgi:hypothetical protein
MCYLKTKEVSEMLDERGYHPLKLPKSKNPLLEILPHRRYLSGLDSFLPGENASGWAEFKEDPNHLPGYQILPAIDILRALSEIAEIAIRSKQSLQKFAFLRFPIKIIICEKVPIQGNLRLPVYAKKIQNTPTSFDTPSRLHGKISAALYTEDKKKILAEIIISFKLQQT